METNKQIFNHEKLYETEIAPLVNKLKKICAQNKVPCFVCTAVSNSETKTKYVYDGILPGFLELKLSDDQFSKHLCVANGFEVKPIGVSNDFADVTDFIADTPTEQFESYIEYIDEDDE